MAETIAGVELDARGRDLGRSLAGFWDLVLLLLEDIWKSVSSLDVTWYWL